jgi:excisionase family DNA binding protein
MNAMVTTPEAAAYLDVTPPHIRLLLYRGDLEGEKIGRDLWITKESLIAYRENRRPVGRPPGSKSERSTLNPKKGAGVKIKESRLRNKAKIT